MKCNEFAAIFFSSCNFLSNSFETQKWLTIMSVEIPFFFIISCKEKVRIETFSLFQKNQTHNYSQVHIFRTGEKQVKTILFKSFFSLSFDMLDVFSWTSKTQM